MRGEILVITRDGRRTDGIEPQTPVQRRQEEVDEAMEIFRLRRGKPRITIEEILSARNAGR